MTQQEGGEGKGRATAPAAAMSDGECRELLVAGRVGMLAMLGEDGPYAVPMAYGWDGESVYIGVSEGLKTALLDRDSRCSFTVWLPGGGDAWRSVIVAGRATWLSTPEERMRAGEALRNQHAPPGSPPPPPPPAPPAGAGGAAPVSRRFTGGRLLRIDGARITGRARG